MIPMTSEELQAWEDSKTETHKRNTALAVSQLNTAVLRILAHQWLKKRRRENTTTP